jgi:hypothetical protein
MFDLPALAISPVTLHMRRDEMSEGVERLRVIFREAAGLAGSAQKVPKLTVARN